MFASKEVEESLVNDVDPIDLEAQSFEKDLNMIGITAVEDVLQDNIEKSLDEIKDAGIKVWMLTGDKDKTAKTIAKNCGLTKGTTLLEVSNENIE